MLGTIVNTSAILAGSLLGSALRRGLAEKYQQALYTAMGLPLFFWARRRW